jgi:hypothetical protein
MDSIAAGSSVSWIALGQEALVDDVVEQGGFAGAGDAAEADKRPER